MHPDPDAVAFGRTEIASSKSFAVSGSTVNDTRSRRSVRPSRLGLRQVVRLEALAEALLDEQRLEHVLDPVRRPDDPLDASLARDPC